MSHLPIFGRRNFLSGMGVAGFALHPLVNAIMKDDQAFAAGLDSMRLVIIPIQTGWGGRYSGGVGQTEADTKMKGYFSADAQGGLVLPNFFASLAPYRTKMNVYDGFMGTWWGNAHDVSWSDYLTNGMSIDTDAFLDSKYPSIDDIVARAWSTRAIRASQSGGWGGGMECWVQEGGMVKKSLQFRDPSASFQAMAGLLPVTGGTTPAQAAKMYDRRKLLMEYVSEDLGRIKQRVPATAFEKLESHLSALEALQNKTMSGPKVTVDGDKCFAPAQPGAFLDGHEERATTADIVKNVRAHFEIIRAGLTCGTHRVAMMSLPNGFGPDKPDDWDWVDSKGVARKGNIWSNNFHEDVSHWDKPDRMNDNRACYEGSVRVRVEWVADFIASLEAVKYADNSSLLDKTLVVLTGEIGDGSHNTSIKPMITIGGGAAIRTNRYVKIPMAIGSQWWTPAQKATLPPVIDGWGHALALRTEGDWWMGVARALGVNLTTFGNPQRIWGKVDIT